MKLQHIVLTALTAFSAAFAGERIINVPLDLFNVVGIRQGWLTAEFAKIGAKVKVVDATNVKLSGAEAALLDRGELNFATRNSYPAFMHKLNGLDAKVIQVLEPSNKYAVSVFVRGDSPYKTIADLKGKTVGTIRYHCGFAGTVEIIHATGHELDAVSKTGDIHWQNLPGAQQLQQALLSGRIDAIGDHAVTTLYVSPILQGQFRVIGDLPDNSIYARYGGRGYQFALRSFVDKNPDAVRAYLNSREKSRVWILAHKQEAAEIGGKELRYPTSIIKFTLESKYQLGYVKPEKDWNVAVAALKQFQVEYKKLGDDLVLRKSLSDAQIDDYIDKRFFKGGEYAPDHFK